MPKRTTPTPTTLTIRTCFTVPTVPVAQPRQRHRIVQGHNGRMFASNYTPKNDPVNAFKAAIQLAAADVLGGPPTDSPVVVTLTCVMPRPKGKVWKTKPMPRYPHTSKPDAENIGKAVLDALTGLAWRDDSQVYSLLIEKYVAAGNEAPHVDIEIAAATAATEEL